MIVIPRKIGESVVINDDIILTVIEVRGDKVRLGVEHPEGSHRSQAGGLRGDPQSAGGWAGNVVSPRRSLGARDESAQTMLQQRSLSLAASAGAKHGQE